MALAQCYYYRLTHSKRCEYDRLICNKLKTNKYLSEFTQNRERDCDFEQVVNHEQKKYIDDLNVRNGICKTRAFKENIFVMLVGIATNTPTIIVGRPGSSKTLAFHTLMQNLAVASESSMYGQHRGMNPKLTKDLQLSKFF